MKVVPHSRKVLLLLSLLAGSASAGLAAQPQVTTDSQADMAQSQGPAADTPVTVYGSTPPPASEMTQGPDVDGIISARSDDKIQVTTADGAKTVVTIGDATKVKGTGGFLGLGRTKLADDALLNGLPVSVKTLQWDGGLMADEVELKNKDLKTAQMIHNGTDQRFAEQTAATEELRGHVADIDEYNVKGTTTVNFDTGKATLSEQAKADLCAAATTAEGMKNALLLVVGYTDSTGSQELNQRLSEKRAARVVNYLQQACGWKPYRMLTPTGMAEADPAASNDTPDGKAQNRRVAVNIMVSKGLDGI